MQLLPVLFTYLLSALHALTLSCIYLHMVNIVQSQGLGAVHSSACKSMGYSDDLGEPIDTKHRTKKLGP